MNRPRAALEGVAELQRLRLLADGLRGLRAGLERFAERAAVRCVACFAEEKDEDDDDPEEMAELIADILYGLYGDEALDHLEAGNEEAEDGPADDDEAGSVVEYAEGVWRFAEWNPLHHPRGSNGRFIARGSSEAVATAKEAVGKVLKGDTSGGGAEKLLEHLHILTVKQLRQLHKEHGQKAPGRLRQQLVDGVKARLEAGKPGGGEKEPSVTPEKPGAEKPAEPVVAEAGGKESEKLPGQVRATVDHAVTRLKDLADTLEHGRRADKQFKGEGRYEADALRNAGDLSGAHETIRTFRKMAVENGVDADKVLAELGLPSEEKLQPSDAAKEWGGEPKGAPAAVPATPAAPPTPAEKPAEARKRPRELSDQEKSYRESARVLGEVMADPAKSSTRDLRIASGELEHEIRSAQRRADAGEITPEKAAGLADSYRREADNVDRLIRDRVNGRSVGPEDLSRAEKIAEKAAQENRSAFTVAREMGLSMDEFRDLRPEVEKHIAEFKKIEKRTPSDARQRAQERQRQQQAGQPGAAEPAAGKPAEEGKATPEAPAAKPAATPAATPAAKPVSLPHPSDAELRQAEAALGARTREEVGHTYNADRRLIVNLPEDAELLGVPVGSELPAPYEGRRDGSVLVYHGGTLYRLHGRGWGNRVTGAEEPAAPPKPAEKPYRTVTGIGHIGAAPGGEGLHSPALGSRPLSPETQTHKREERERIEQRPRQPGTQSQGLEVEPMPQKEHYSQADIGRGLGFKPATIGRWIDRGLLKLTNGKVAQADLDTFLDDHGLRPTAEWTQPVKKKPAAKERG